METSMEYLKMSACCNRGAQGLLHPQRHHHHHSQVVPAAGREAGPVVLEVLVMPAAVVVAETLR